MSGKSRDRIGWLNANFPGLEMRRWEKNRRKRAARRERAENQRRAALLRHVRRACAVAFWLMAAVLVAEVSQ